MKNALFIIVQKIRVQRNHGIHKIQSLYFSTTKIGVRESVRLTLNLLVGGRA